MAEQPKPKTRWCESCNRRHRLDHDHFKKAKPSRADAQIVGSDTAAGLADRFDEEVAGGRKPLSAAEIEQKKQEEIEALQRSWARRWRWVYAALGKLLHDPNYPLTKEEERDGGEVYAAMQVAWGFAPNSKAGTAFDAMAWQLTIMAARSKFIQALLEEAKNEEEVIDVEASPVVQ